MNKVNHMASCRLGTDLSMIEVIIYT